MLKILQNSKTENYKKLKENIFSPFFPWFYSGNTIEDPVEIAGFKSMPQYAHVFLSRPEEYGWSQPASELHELAAEVIREILKENGFYPKNYFFLRIASNCISPDEGIQLSLPHEDHNFPHFNFLTYLTSSGGSTFVEGQEHRPVEDQSILFTGKHYMQLPKKERRIVLVATFMTCQSSLSL